ncbi:hypothetical protein [Alteromonas portus]|uniref:hypothetical protein n=1 Tax=Alteromonas portus TaxID=2565549 RepID=UPI003BF7A649
MGDSNNTPIEKLAPQYKVVITQLYESGELIESGRAFTLYPGSDSFRKLKSAERSERNISEIKTAKGER